MSRLKCVTLVSVCVCGVGNIHWRNTSLLLLTNDILLIHIVTVISSYYGLQLLVSASNGALPLVMSGKKRNIFKNVSVSERLPLYSNHRVIRTLGDWKKEKNRCSHNEVRLSVGRSVPRTTFDIYDIMALSFVVYVIHQ